MLKKTILYCDMDGTLIAEFGSIPEINKQAVRRFTEAGGLFSVATGRTVPVARTHFNGLNVNAPIIVSNGSAVYDLETESYIFTTTLPDSLAGDIVALAKRRYDDSLIELFGKGHIRMLGDPTNDPYLLKEGADYEAIELQSAYSGAFKVIVMGEYERLLPLKGELDAEFSGLIETAFSSPFYLEIMPKGVSKGAALKRLCGEKGWELSSSAAIGDFLNDIELLEAASFSAAPENARDEAKAVADITVCHCDSGAVADFIDNYLLG